VNEDARAKLGLQALLSPFVPLRVHHEVQPPAQFVDLYVSAPPASPDAMIETLGTLGRMASQPALLEASSDTVTLEEARDCQRKQLTLHHTLTLDANRQRPPGGAPVAVPFPWLWILSLGEPRAVLNAWVMSPSGRWPDGIERSNEAMAVGVVVLRRLEVTRETITLRLFGDEPMRQRASRELQAMSEEDPLRRAVGQMLYRWRIWLKGHPEDEETRRRLMDFEQLVEQETLQLKNEARYEGHKEGLQEGRREEAQKALTRVLTRRGLGLNAAQHAQIRRCAALSNATL